MSNKARRALFRDMTKNPTVILTVLQKSSSRMAEPARRATIAAALHPSGLYARNMILGQWFTSQRESDVKHTAKTTPEWLRDKCLTVLEWPSQSSDLNHMEQWRDLEVVVHRCLPFILTELERICQGQWDQLPKSRCVKLVETYPRSLKALTTAKGASTENWIKVLNTFCKWEFIVFNS